MTGSVEVTQVLKYLSRTQVTELLVNLRYENSLLAKKSKVE